MGINVTKMNASGNDYILMNYDDFSEMNITMSEVAKQICDRHFGVGADGLIIPYTNLNDADISWFLYNAEGKTVKMSPNAMRCFAQFVRDNGLVDKDEFSVKTLSGLVNPIILEDGNVIIKMSKPVLEKEKIPFVPNHNLNYKIAVGDRIFEGTALLMEDMHFVIFVNDNDDLNELVLKYGHFIEDSPEFPEKTNVEFVKIRSHQKIDVAVWEKNQGVSIGTPNSACASVIVGILNDILENKVKVNLPGGDVTVLWEGSLHDRNVNAYLSGTSEYIFEADWNYKNKFEDVN